MYSICMYSFCFHTISDQETRHIPLHLLQQGQTRLLCKDSDYCWDSIGMRRFRLLLGQYRYAEIQIIVGQCKYAEIQIIVGKFCSKRPEQFTHIFHSFFQKKSYIKHAKIFLQKLDFRFFSQKCFVQIAHSLISSELP